MNFLAELFCKKRKSPQPSHPLVPIKQISRAQTSNSSNDNDDTNNRLRESTQTQLISESEEEVPRSETKSSQGGAKVNDEISTTTASSKKKKEQDLQTKREKSNKVTDVKPKADNFMQGEGLQAVVRKRQNNEDVQRENGKEKTQEQKGNNDIEARDSQELDEDEFSDDVSYQSSSSSSLADFDGISQVESEYISREDKRSLESPERDDTKRVPKIKETQIIERSKAEALEELKHFPLSELKLTKERCFDTRRTLTKKYLALCKETGQDARSYYYNEMYKPEKQGIAKDSGEKLKQNGLKKATVEQEENDSERALRELEKFPLNELKLTKDELFDQRYKKTKVYLDLCEKVKKNPEQYYKENLK